MQQKTFNGNFNYSYVETGYNEDKFKQVYDNQIKTLKCVLKLPDENGKNILEMEFRTPDEKHKSFVSINLNEIIINGSDTLLFGIHFKSWSIEDSKVIIQGNFILQIIGDADEYHRFNFTSTFEDLDVINEILAQKLINS